MLLLYWRRLIVSRWKKVKRQHYTSKVAVSPVFQEKRNKAKIKENPDFTQNIDCEVLFFTDSNHGTSAEKIFCPTLGDIDFT